MNEYVTKEQVIDWCRPYGHTDGPIPFETTVSDLRVLRCSAHGGGLMHTQTLSQIQYLCMESALNAEGGSSAIKTRLMRRTAIAGQRWTVTVK